MATGTKPKAAGYRAVSINVAQSDSLVYGPIEKLPTEVTVAARAAPGAGVCISFRG
jgi:hypothetical protein